LDDGLTEITLPRASDGDCIFVRCIDGDESFNMLVDAGRASAVARLKRFIASIPERQQSIDLFELVGIASYLRQRINVRR
jgi:hypothetical protein